MTANLDLLCDMLEAELSEDEMEKESSEPSPIPDTPKEEEQPVSFDKRQDL